MKPHELVDHLVAVFSDPTYSGPHYAGHRRRVVAHLRELATARLAACTRNADSPSGAQAKRLLRACEDAEQRFDERVRLQLLMALRGLEDDALGNAEAVYLMEQRRRGGGGPEKRAQLADRDRRMARRVADLEAIGHATPKSQVAAEFGVSTRTLRNALQRLNAET